MKSGALDRMASDYEFTLRSGLMRQLHEIFVMENPPNANEVNKISRIIQQRRNFDRFIEDIAALR